MTERPAAYAPDGLTLFGGGSFDWLWRRLGLARLQARRLDRRVVLIPILLWLPTLVLSAVSGLAWSGTGVPFLHDLEVQARFLVALPLLIYGERYADSVLAVALDAFVKKRIVQEKDLARFEHIVASTNALSRSPALLVLLIAFVVLAGRFVWQGELITMTGTWHSQPTDTGLQTTLAGYWYALIAVPVFQFILYRWYLRILLWWSLLLRVSRLDLQLVATDPDRAGGLGFLGYKIYAFWPFLFAQGFIVSGIVANRVFHEQRRLVDSWPEIALAAAIFTILVLGPLTAFAVTLIRARRQGLLEYDLLAARYVEEFQRKWVRDTGATAEPLIGSPDIQSLADLAGGAEVVVKMRSVPFGKEEVLKVVAPFALPILPLVLTMIPVSELLVEILKALV